MVSKTKRILVFHPFLFAVYAILGNYSNNSTQVPVQWVVRPLLVLLFLVGLTYYGLSRKLGDVQRTGLVVTLALFWFFFGHFQRALAEQSGFWGTGVGLGMAFVLWTAPLAFLGSRWTWSRITNRSLITSFLNFTSLFVLLLPIYITGSSVIQTVRETRRYETERSMDLPIAPGTPRAKPDIYYFILDGYGRQDVLRDIHGFDNSEFIESLREKGFYVADQSTANYPQTQLSLSSTLTMEYLNEYVQEFGDSDDHTLVYELVQRSTVRRLVEGQGYTFVALPSSTLITQIRDADIYFDLSPIAINEFEASLLSSTVIGVAAESWGVDLPVMGYEWHHKTIRFTLDKLREVPQIPGPKFVFAHIMLPHPPFIFDRNGNFVPPDRPYASWDASFFPGTTQEYQKGYTEQVVFINREIIEIVSKIITQSANPPIIILQGDHGPGAFFDLLELKSSCLSERYSILNAYYFPDGDYQFLYASITPVNSFRVILNQYFGAKLAMLEDRNYYATWTAPYLYTDVTSKVTAPCSIPTGHMR